MANLGLSKSENSTAQATGVSGKISKKSSMGIETTFSPSVAYVNDEGSSSGVGVSLSVPLLRGFGKDYNYDPVYLMKPFPGDLVHRESLEHGSE